MRISRAVTNVTEEVTDDTLYARAADGIIIAEESSDFTGSERYEKDRNGFTAAIMLFIAFNYDDSWSLYALCF